MVWTRYWESRAITLLDAYSSTIGIHNIVYFKPSASGRCPHFTPVKPIIIATLWKRAENYCSTDNLLQKELQHLHSTIVSNGYHHHLVTLDIHPQPPNTTTTPEDNSTQSTFCEQSIQKTAIKCNIISLYKKTTTQSNIFYYGDLLYQTRMQQVQDTMYLVNKFARNITLEKDPKQSVLKKIAASGLPSCSLTNNLLRWLLLCVSLLRNFSWIWFW